MKEDVKMKALEIFVLAEIFVLLVRSNAADIKEETKGELLFEAIIKKANELTKQQKSFQIDKKDVVAEKRDPHELHHSPTIMGHCDMSHQCKADEYCHGTFCHKCRKEGDTCDLNGECCKGSECQYGVCEKGAKAGDFGTFCDKVEDCKGESACCIHEVTVSHHHSICKPMLEEHESCGPINLFHQDVPPSRTSVQQLCGPCKPSLSCKGVGLFGRHSVCLPEGEE